MKGIIGQSALLIVMVVFRILTMLIAYKFLSNRFGASGFGLLSQVMAVAALFSTFAGGGLTNGLIKEVSGAPDEKEKMLWLSAGLTISIASAAVLAIISVGLYLFGANPVLGDPALAWVFLLIGFAQILTGAGNTAQSYLSGIRDIRSVALVGVIGAALSVFLIVILSFMFGITGAVVGCAILALSPSLFAIVFLALKRSFKFSHIITLRYEKARVRSLMHYSLAMIVAASAVPLVLIFMRLRLSQTAGWDTVGHWQAVSRIGDAYIQVFGALFMSIVLPKLADLKGKENITVMLKFIPPIMGLFLFGATVFWLFSSQVLALAYSKSFVSSSSYVVPQLLADFFKILSSFFIYRFVAMGRPYVQALGEVIQAIIMLATFLILLPGLSGQAAVWSYGAGAGAVLIFAIVATTVDGSRRGVA
jgi:O-antigen/teichoic acid export membrane protein